MAVVLESQGERLDLCLSGPGLDWAGWFMVLAKRGVRGLKTEAEAFNFVPLMARGRA